MPVYAIFLLSFFVVPVLVLAWVLRAAIRRYPRTILWSLAFVYVIGLPWDWLSVRTGVWRYDTAPTLGVWFDGLPIEELAGFYVFGTLFVVLAVLAALRRSPRV